LTTDSHAWPIFGHDWAVDHLRKSLINGRVRHGYLIVGAESVGKETLAVAFAMALNCLHEEVAARPCGECRSCRKILSGSHPDMLYSQQDANTGALKIEELRSVAGKLSLKPFEARYRIAIFRNFDKAQPRAQDALLKTLEEPPPYAVLILLTPSIEPILPTITSRSQVLHLRPAAAETVYDVLRTHAQADDQTAWLLARLSGGRIGWALQALRNPDLLEQRTAALDLLEGTLGKNRAGRFDLAEDLSKDKASLAPLLGLWQTYWRDLLLLTENSGIEPANADRMDTLRRLASRVSPEKALGALNATSTMLDHLTTNANVRLALEVMFLDYPGLASGA
jgi:DNA polymerase III subunit delta'